VHASNATLDLFGGGFLPEGMKYQPEFLSANEERALLADLSRPENRQAGEGRRAGAREASLVRCRSVAEHVAPAVELEIPPCNGAVRQRPRIALKVFLRRRRSMSAWYW
jgi:hypothetical protein